MKTSTMKTTITSAELLPKLEEARTYVSNSTVGFVRAYQIRQSKEPQPEDFVADLGGSGTLIQAGGSKGILTADHVLDELPEAFGLVLPTTAREKHQQAIVQATRRIRVGRGTDASKGPDLALIVLSPVDSARLEAQGAVFYNLSARRARLHDQPLRLDKNSALVLCGMVGERTCDISPTLGFERAMAFCGTFGPVVLAGSRQEQSHDYLSVEVMHDGDYTGPASFKGCSGGSLWHVELKRTGEGAIVVGDPLLCGVPFYESGNDGGRSLIECHGIKSVYDSAVDALQDSR